MDYHLARDVDETRNTSPYSDDRCQQLGREKSQLVGVDGLLDSAVSGKDQQTLDPLLPKTLKVKDDLKDGVFCTLCHIVTWNNALMEQHLIGPAHLSNIEAERFRENNKLNLSFSNKTVKATSSGVEVGCQRNKDPSREIDQRVIEDKNIKDTTHIETDNVVMQNKDIQSEIAEAQSKTATEESNTGCGLCEYFEGDDKKYQMPEHFCLHGLKTPELPAGWAVYTSRTSGRTFYTNILTNETQWDFPTEPVVDELPKGWAMKRAKCKGLPFYVNTVTGDWQWDHPNKSIRVDVSEDLGVETLEEEETLSDVAVDFVQK